MHGAPPSKRRPVTESEFLSSSDLHQLTGMARAAGQVAWLVEKRIPHRADGRRVIVSRFHARAWLEGKQAVISKGPNWASVK